MRKPKDDGPVSSDVQQKLVQVHERLCAEYHCPIPFFSNRDPLSLLVSSLLSHRTKNADTGRAVRQLHSTFHSWQAIRDAPVADLQAAISAATWPEQKAPRIQQVLRLITERVGRLSLDCLSETSVPEARAWLESLPGVGPKTSAQVYTTTTRC